MIDPEIKQKFLNELRERPNISVAAKRHGLQNSTVHRWRKEDPTFAKAVTDALKDGRKVITDLAEGKLIAAIQSGHRWAIQMWLEAHEKRFYKPRKAMSAPPEHRVLTSMQVQIVNPDGSYKDETGAWRNTQDMYKPKPEEQKERPLVQLKNPPKIIQKTTGQDQP